MAAGARRLAGDARRSGRVRAARRAHLHGRRSAVHDRPCRRPEHAVAGWRRAPAAPRPVRQGAASCADQIAAGRRRRDRGGQAGHGPGCRRGRRRRAAELRRGLAGPLAVAVMAQMLGLDVPPGQLLAWYDAIVAGVSALAEADQATETEAAARAAAGAMPVTPTAAAVSLRRHCRLRRAQLLRGGCAR